MAGFIKSIFSQKKSQDYGDSRNSDNFQSKSSADSITPNGKNVPAHKDVKMFGDRRGIQPSPGSYHPYLANGRTSAAEKNEDMTFSPQPSFGGHFGGSSRVGFNVKSDFRNFSGQAGRRSGASENEGSDSYSESSFEKDGGLNFGAKNFGDYGASSFNKFGN